MVTIMYHVQEDKTDKRGRRGESRQDGLRIISKERHFLLLGDQAKNNFHFLFDPFLMFKMFGTEHTFMISFTKEYQKNEA